MLGIRPSKGIKSNMTFSRIPVIYDITDRNMVIILKNLSVKFVYKFLLTSTKFKTGGHRRLIM